MINRKSRSSQWTSALFISTNRKIEKPHCAYLNIVYNRLKEVFIITHYGVVTLDTIKPPAFLLRVLYDF
jgi:hypothetical protein